MRTRSAARFVSAALSAVLLLTACGSGGAGDGSGADPRPPVEPKTAGTNPSASLAIIRWDPCEVLGDHFNALVEHLNYVKLESKLLSKKVNQGVPMRNAMCGSGRVLWAEDPRYSSGNADGMTTISLIPKDTPEEAAAEYAALLDEKGSLLGEGRAEKELTGDWDEGVLMLGEGIGDTFYLLVRDGTYMIEILLETGSDLVKPTGGTNANFTVEQARDYLINEALPNVHSTVKDRLEADGVTLDE
jgi:hypothetical protein